MIDDFSGFNSGVFFFIFCSDVFGDFISHLWSHELRDEALLKTISPEGQVGALEREEVAREERMATLSWLWF